MQLYNSFDWNWIVGGDETRAYSSKAKAYVTQWDTERVTRIASEAELWDVLRAAGVLPQPITEVSRAQAKIALKKAGLLDQIEAFVASSNDDILKIAWADTGAFARHGRLVTALAPQFKLTDAMLDDLFTAAAAEQL